MVCCVSAALIFLAGGLLFPREKGPSRPAEAKAAEARRPAEEQARLVDHGRYLAAIGACAACHTPPDVAAQSPGPIDTAALDKERRFRTEPDWFQYMDTGGHNYLSGGVPFHLRFSGTSNGVVYSSNITPDPDTGLGGWTEDEIVRAIRAGERKAGSSPSLLYLFPPHSFFSNLAEDDARALAAYLKIVVPVPNKLLSQQSRHRHLPADQAPRQPAVASELKVAPTGRSLERGRYLINSLVGCRECHSYQKFTEKGPVLQEFVGGDPSDPFVGVFRLGPDLPLRPDERGFAVFPYPGYAVLYAGNLTRFGAGGDLNHVRTEEIVRAIREGVSTQRDKYGRPQPLAHVMLWQFYASMTDDDAFSIAEYLKTLRYMPHSVEPRLKLYGTDWEAAFRQVYGSFNALTGGPDEVITDADRNLLGKEAK